MGYHDNEKSLDFRPKWARFQAWYIRNRIEIPVTAAWFMLLCSAQFIFQEAFDPYRLWCLCTIWLPLCVVCGMYTQKGVQFEKMVEREVDHRKKANAYAEGMNQIARESRGKA